MGDTAHCAASRDDERFNDRARHAYRPQEIFAEDFRVLFGGAAAYFGGSIENTEHPASPKSVAGWRASSFAWRVTPLASRAPRIAATSYPNPFNPGHRNSRLAAPPK